MNEYYIGFDIGTDSIHSAVLDKQGNIVSLPKSIMHFGNAPQALQDIYEEIISIYGYENIATTFFTGSVGKFIAENIGMPFIHDTISIPLGINLAYPEAEYIFHIGAKDPYFFKRENWEDSDEKNSFIPDHGTGTKCGGGSGILLAKQCRRFYEHQFPVKLTGDRKTNRKLIQEQLLKIFEASKEETEQSDKNIDVGGRCGVVIQSDMIHLQNRGEKIANIMRGMLERVVKNYKCDVLRTRMLDKTKKAVATGGIFRNAKLVKLLEKELGLPIEVPKNFLQVGALGAALRSLKVPRTKFRPEELEKVAQAEKEKVKMAPPLSSAWNKVKLYEESNFNIKKEDLVIFEEAKGDEKWDVVIGLDGGSTTTKAVIAKMKDLKIAAEICLNTNGKPLYAIQEVMRQIRKYLANKIKIKGITYTGSSGAFYHKLFTRPAPNSEKISIDLIKDEITCHALGVKHFNKNVDTIFELGGQDAKFTLFNEDGTVKKAKMNLSCMAGTGQTMHNMVEMIGLDIKSTFHEYALKAKSTPVVDETCGVFTESGITKLIAMGFSREDLAAAIAFGFMGGYVNKFVGNEKYGKYASAQGGPFNGKACLAALALHTQMEVHAFPHRQLFGAYGAAIAAVEEIKKAEKNKVLHECRFRGLDIADMEFKKNVQLCSQVVKNSCSIRDCQLETYRIGNEIIFSGGLCPKGNSDSFSKKAPDYIARYNDIIEKHLSKLTKKLEAETEKERVLIPRSLSFLNDRGIFYAALYKNLGFDVCVSPPSDDVISNLGINHSHSETCYPVKLAHGHGAYLSTYLRQGKDKMLLANTIGQDIDKKKFCPYVSAAGFLVKDAVGLNDSDVLLPVLHFNDRHYPIEKAIQKDLKRVHKSFSLNKIKKAVFKAKQKEKEYLKEIHATGEKIIKELKEKGEKIFIGVGRGYTVLDKKASSEVHQLFSSYGMHFIPAIFLKLPNIDISKIADNMYWVQGANIIKYNLRIAKDPQLYAVRETNFNCGSDSFILFHEEDIIKNAKKPHLVLQTDGHNSNAQFGTRILANNEVVKNHQPQKISSEVFEINQPENEFEKRILGIPYMGDSSYCAAASFRAFSYKSRVIPTQTKRSQELARKISSTNTCRPFSFQIGDALGWLYDLREKGFDPNQYAAVFEPKASGPCRFGQYSVMLRKFFDAHGFTNVPVISPNAENDYNDMPLSKRKLVQISSLVYRAVLYSDLLLNFLLRTRPYEKECGSAEKLYDTLLKDIEKLVEKKPSAKMLAQFLKKASFKFNNLMDKTAKVKPLIVMSGEIFVRCHPIANQNSAKLLEKYGLEVTMTSPSIWMEYVNKSNLPFYKRTHQWKKFLAGYAKKWYMGKVKSKIYGPIANNFKGRESHDPEHVINAAQKALIYEKLIRGESPLSIGEAYLFSKNKLGNICGIYHVGPFSCMHETAATSQIQALIQKRRRQARKIGDKIIPFMDGVFGDSELPNLEAEIAAFSEKCHLKQQMLQNSKKHSV